MDGSCVDTHKQSYYLQLFDIEGTDKQFYWNKCPCNESDAMIRRHCIPTIPNYDVNNQALKDLRSWSVGFAERVRPLLKARSTLKEVVDQSRPSIKQRYKRAYRDLVYKRVDISEKHAMAKAFIKFEKIPLTKFEEGKAPRLIQYRSFEYLLLLKSCIKPFSDAIKTRKILHSNSQPLDQIYTKTLTPAALATAMRDSWNSFPSPVAVCLDHSKFDGHYAKELLDIEHDMWLVMFKSYLLKKLLKLQVNNVGFSQCGFKYKIKGTRLSGEYTTSDGNTTTNLGMIEVWLQSSGVTKYRLHINGDDSVVILDSSDLDKLLPLDFFNNFNMETELEAIAYDFRHIKYCQTSPIRVGGAWRMVKDPIRTLSRMSYADAKYALCRQRYVLGISLCELAVSSGVPMLQSFCLRNLNSKAKPLGSVDKYPAKVASQKHLELQDISLETRTDFAEAFGISLSQQYAFEHEMAGQTDELALIVLEKYKQFHLQ